MKSDSNLFDSIRVKPKGAKAASDGPQCQHAGCEAVGVHKAPMGRGREGEFFQFCIDHVREYNKRYNYFSGMSDEELSEFRAGAATGHRPTWDMGANRDSRGTAARPSARTSRPRARARRIDPHELFEDATGTASPSSHARRTLGAVERKCLTALELDENATGPAIKKRYKELVKRHHPDANGGDRASEDKLREVIQAYNYLKQAGLC